MPNMPQNAQYGPYMKKLDDFLSTAAGRATAAAKLDDWVAAGKTNADFAQIGLDLGFLFANPQVGMATDQDAYDHFLEHWLDTVPGKSFWPGVPNTAEILATAYRAAINMADSYNCGIASLWICDGNTDHVWVVYGRIGTQVVVIIHTNRQPGPPNLKNPQPLYEVYSHNGVVEIEPVNF